MKYKENFSTGTLMAPATPRIQAGKFSEPKSSEPPGEALKTSKYQLSVSGKKIGYGHRVCGLDLGGVQEIPNLATTAECSWGTSFTTHICFLAISLTSHFWILILRLTCQAQCQTWGSTVCAFDAPERDQIIHFGLEDAGNSCWPLGNFSKIALCKVDSVFSLL